MPSENILAIRVDGADYEALRKEAERRRLPISAYARMLLLEAHYDGLDPTLEWDPLIRALQENRELRLKLRRLIHDPREGD